MKKLLALVLCVMLFVSVIPTSAFAATSTGSAVSLYNAVQQMNDLYTAYAQLAVSTAAFNSYNGWLDLAELFPRLLPDFDLGVPDNLRMSLARIFSTINAGIIATAYKNGDLDVTGPMSPEGIFEAIGPALAEMYDNVGRGVVSDCTRIELFKTAEITKNVAEEYAKIAELIPAAPAEGND